MDGQEPKLIHSSSSHKYLFWYLMGGIILTLTYIGSFLLGLATFSDLQITIGILIVFIVLMYFFSYQSVMILKKENKILVITKKIFRENMREYEITDLIKIVLYVVPRNLSNHYSIEVRGGEYINLLRAGEDDVQGKKAILILADELGLKVVDVFGTEVDRNMIYHNSYSSGFRRILRKLSKHHHPK